MQLRFLFKKLKDYYTGKLNLELLSYKLRNFDKIILFNLLQ